MTLTLGNITKNRTIRNKENPEGETFIVVNQHKENIWKVRSNINGLASLIEPKVGNWEIVQ